MAKPRLKAEFSMDAATTGIVNGYIEGIADNISTKQYVDSAVQYASESLTGLFEMAVDAEALKHKPNWYHVYNWGKSYKDYSTVGVPTNRLWKMVVTGSGRNRSVGFTFLPETVPSPLEPELIALGVKEGVHIFTWKATVMEYGIPVTIKPLGNNQLIYVQNGKVYRRKDAVTTVPGYRTTTGVFSAFYVAWWGGVAPSLYATLIKPQLETDVITNNSFAKVIKQATRRRRKDIGISAIDEETGRALAIRHMEKNKIDYRRRARRRRLERYGNDDG